MPSAKRVFWVALVGLLSIAIGRRIAAVRTLLEG